jgi:hypothetical protein
MKNRALVFAAGGLLAGLLLDEYWPTIVQAVRRYDNLREMSGQDSLMQNLVLFLSSSLGKKADGTPAGTAAELYEVFRERMLDDLLRYAKLKSL